ncbi:hypothetical protein PLEOSDRAFT_1111081 [Pleurotus ostreatus PC15]|uniref:T6SS Phospholipase effector Tle1-like catalytic domain-containing protein n=1 Tax=Pleurotus ostreatus (strain PC15) TaxID=1137138 RepID=A0A067NVX6_PLEO1|nr:hypothetical protein PLEOSDRAFT_1111081 [Pleurotus ostreatus PC15]
MSESSEWLNGHGQQESVATLVDAGPAEQVRESKAQLPPLSPSSPIIVEGDPSVIPPEHPFRTLVLCFDGTGDQFDGDNSNIVQLFTLLKKDDRDVQMVYYQAGIGTYTSPNIATPLMAKVSKTLDEMIAWNLGRHVMDGYEFLMQNYKAGDRICIFGFSRGAYTARALAGMIHKVGLLPACNHQQVPFAYKMFKRADETGWKQSNAFKKAFSVDVDIEFIGVWDTVSSVGLIPRKLPFTTSNTIVRTFRHAIALDERRAKFKANHWNRPNTKEQTLSISDHHRKAHKNHPHATNPRLKALERKYTKDHSKQTDIEEVWFAGCHCDVGGGSVPNETQHSLARIPLRWMIRECFKTNTGIMFDCEGLQALGLDPGALFPEVLPRPPMATGFGTLRIQDIPKSISGPPDDTQLPNFADAGDFSALYKSEEDHDLLDLLSPVYDQLSLAPYWWVLEVWPVKQRYQKSDNSWASYLGFNMGAGRIVPKQKRGVKVHRSVKVRMEALHSNGTPYIPRASFEKALAAGKVEWVD